MLIFNQIHQNTIARRIIECIIILNFELGKSIKHCFFSMDFLMSSLFTKVTQTASLFALTFLLAGIPHKSMAQTYINEDSSAADMDEEATGEEHQAFRNEHYNDLIANLEISTQALEQAQQMGQTGEALRDKKKAVKKYLKLVTKQIEDISELSDQSERVENELQQMRQAKDEGEAVLENRDLDDY
ncbi:glucose transporter type 1-like protein [Lasius niger]|uniref:Glucose transporter type 1-like protein n=1 Tax=Lasius niger TaxID=67767 RepID=A0A0J7KB50_LASNI|nr:glucose transporter type 1-like protein [Lasius niger]